jgi:hypothetical protein
MVRDIRPGSGFFPSRIRIQRSKALDPVSHIFYLKSEELRAYTAFIVSVGFFLA